MAEITDEEQDVLNDIAYENSKCKHCGLPMRDHDDPDWCPPGTEEFGGRR